MNEENKAVELTDEQLEQVNGGVSFDSLDGLTWLIAGNDFWYNGIHYTICGTKTANGIKYMRYQNNSSCFEQIALPEK